METIGINLYDESDYLYSGLKISPTQEVITQLPSQAKSGNRAAMRMMKHAVAAQPNIQSLENQLKTGNLKAVLCAKEIKGEELLHQAILENSPVVVQFLIGHGVDVNALDANGKTPLIVAIEKGYTNIADLFIQAKANLEIRRKSDNFSPLEIAISLNNSYTATQLLNAGANANSGRIGQPNLLAQALNKAMIDISDLLIQKGAEINVGDSKISNPLFQAFLLPEPYRTQIINQLLSKGVDLNRKLENQTTVFSSIIDSALINPQALQLIRIFCEKGADVHAKNATGQSALEFAANKPQIMSILNEYRKDVGYLNEQLNLAVQQKNRSLVQKWVAKGANINNTDMNSQTCLYRTFSSGDVSFSQFLVDNGAKIDQSNLPPLFEIVEKQIFSGQTLLDVADFCLRNNAISANSVDKSGRPLISVAVMVGNLALVQKLVAYGAAVEPDKKINGMTPLQLALKFQNEPIARFLIEKDANVNAGVDQDRVIILVLQKSMSNLIPLLLDRKVQLNVGTDWNENPLAHVVVQGNLDLVKKFISNGADVNYKINNQMPNVLFFALYYNANSSIIEHLLQNNVKTDVKDGLGHSPMWWAIQHGKQEIVALLLKYGANQEDIG